MRKFLVFVFFLFAVAAASFAGVHRVGTYNIRYPASGDTLERAWNNRKPYVVKMLKDTMNYDVVALQEVYNSSYWNYLKDKMSAYTFYANTDVYGVAIAYRTSKYNCLDKGYFKLVPSPKPSGWEALQTRWAVWAKLQDKTSKEIFYFTATHLDLYDISIREGARICAERMREIAGDYACIITGDMNCEPSARDPHANFKQYYGNSREMCKTTPQGSYFTFASGMNPSAANKWIDYIYVRGVEVESYFVNNSTLGRTLMPSDHMPVLCEVSILPKLRATTHVVNNVDELRQAARFVQPEDIIYLNSGTYDLGDSTLTVVNSCVMEADDNVVITGGNQLITTTPYVSLELRGVHFQNATTKQSVYGSILNCNGNYLTLTDCSFSRCQTTGVGLVYTTDCKLTVDHCLFRDNVASKKAGGVVVTSDQSGYTFPFTLTNSSFVNNRAYHAPAVYLTSNHTAYIANNGFVSNQSTERGCVLIEAVSNTTDIRLVNNSFITNTINAQAGLLDAKVGGSAVWQNMDAKGCLTMVNNTIVGNYTASRTKDGATSPKFQSGAVHSATGNLKIYNNVIAGNYSSCPGRGDVSLADTANVKGGYNVFSSQDNTNYTLSPSDISAPNYADALQSLVDLYGGSVEDSVYHAPILVYGEMQDVWALSPLTAQYAGQNIAVLDQDARSAATIQSDILNVGSSKGILSTDQAGIERLDISVPGAMEVGQKPTELEEVQNAECIMHGEIHNVQKVIINHQLYIVKDGVRYNMQGVQL